MIEVLDVDALNIAYKIVHEHGNPWDKDVLEEEIAAALMRYRKSTKESKMSDLRKHVEALIKKAEESEKSDDALKFSQAAENAANAACALRTAEKEKG